MSAGLERKTNVPDVIIYLYTKSFAFYWIEKMAEERSAVKPRMFQNDWSLLLPYFFHTKTVQSSTSKVFPKEFHRKQ